MTTSFQKDLESLRSQIDDIDNKLLELLVHRVEISSIIAKMLKLPEDWISELFKIVLLGCRTISHERLENERSSREYID